MLGNLNTDLIKQAKQLQNPAESEALQLWANSLAQMEHDLQVALRDHQQALGVSGPVDPVDVEERTDEVLAFADAYLSRDVEAFWLDEQAPDGLDAEHTAPYLGMSAEAWRDQRETWVARYREQGGDRFANVSDREIVATHVESTFGVSLDVFEQQVVQWSKADALRDAVLGRFELVESALKETTAAVESGNIEP